MIELVDVASVGGLILFLETRRRQLGDVSRRRLRPAMSEQVAPAKAAALTQSEPAIAVVVVSTWCNLRMVPPGVCRTRLSQGRDRLTPVALPLASTRDSVVHQLRWYQKQTAHTHDRRPLVVVTEHNTRQLRRS